MPFTYEFMSVHEIKPSCYREIRSNAVLETLKAGYKAFRNYMVFVPVKMRHFFDGENWLPLYMWTDGQYDYAFCASNSKTQNKTLKFFYRGSVKRFERKTIEAALEKYREVQKAKDLGYIKPW